MTSRNGPGDVEFGALSHLRIVEFGGMPAAYAAGFMGGLGADVIKIEPPGGDLSRSLPPFAGDIASIERSIPFLNANVNKRSIVLNLDDEADRRTFSSLLERADVLIDSSSVGYLDFFGFDDSGLLNLNPGLVTVSMTPFGRTGPYTAYAANDAVVSAMSGVVMSQGDDTRPPVVPPCQISYQLAAIHAAYLALGGLRHMRRTGHGQRIDLSLVEAITFAGGSAVARYAQRSEIAVRPGASGGAYNIYQCKDGRFVNIAIFMPGHWHILTREWMEDPVLSDPAWDSTQYRTDNEDLIKTLLGGFVMQFDADEFVEEGQRRGIACSPVNDFEHFVTSDHMRERGWFQRIEHPVVGGYDAPGAPFIMSKTPWRQASAAPLLDQHRQEILGELANVAPRPKPVAGDPGAAEDDEFLAGIRVADTTRAFAGPTGTMFLGFYGAEVIKVESSTLQANRELTSPFFPDMNRNKLSCTIDMRTDEGKALFMRLAAESDVVIDNFSATVMSRLGLGYDDLEKVRTDVIQIGMPGMGKQGPLNRWVTYGNSLQAFTGLTLLWGYSDSPMEAHAKGVVPDYSGAAMVAFSTAAAIEYRDHSGEGQAIEIAQVDGQAALLGPAILDYTINNRSWGSVGYDEPLTENMSPYGIYPCNQADNWVVIACENDDQWKSLVTAMGEPGWSEDSKFSNHAGRKVNREEMDSEIGQWTNAFTPGQVLRLLQAQGVPAGIAMNGEQVFLDRNLRARNHIVDVEHQAWGPLVHQGLPGIPAVSRASAAVKAPWIGDSNDYVFGEVLKMSAEDIQRETEIGAIN
jgi:crotonobetainyl-CoA:carnitine CoA-transferase CaiB-like acyl-CoA transferase